MKILNLEHFRFRKDIIEEMNNSLIYKNNFISL